MRKDKPEGKTHEYLRPRDLVVVVHAETGITPPEPDQYWEVEVSHPDGRSVSYGNEDSSLKSLKRLIKESVDKWRTKFDNPNMQRTTTKAIPSKVPESFTLPARLDKVLDEVGIGAVLKRISDDQKAVLVDWVGDQPLAIVAMLSKQGLRSLEGATTEPRLPTKPSDYCITFITDDTQWLVLTIGQDDYVLCE